MVPESRRFNYLGYSRHQDVCPGRCQYTTWYSVLCHNTGHARRFTGRAVAVVAAGNGRRQPVPRHHRAAAHGGVAVPALVCGQQCRPQADPRRRQRVHHRSARWWGAARHRGGMQKALRRVEAVLAAEGELKEDLLLGLARPHHTDRVVDALDDDQLARSGAGPATVPRSWTAVTSVARLMAETGVRAGELIAMTVADLDLDRGSAVVRKARAPSKGGLPVRGATARRPGPLPTGAAQNRTEHRRAVGSRARSPTARRCSVRFCAAPGRKRSRARTVAPNGRLCLAPLPFRTTAAPRSRSISETVMAISSPARKPVSAISRTTASSRRSRNVVPWQA